MITDKAEIAARAHALAELRVPFVHQGRSTAGIDCVGVLCHSVGYTQPTVDYPRDPINGELETQLEEILGPPVVEVSRSRPLTSCAGLQVGDIVSMQYAGPIRHVAIVVPHVSFPGVLSIVHSEARIGAVVEHILDAKWLRRIVKVWRL